VCVFNNLRVPAAAILVVLPVFGQPGVGGANHRPLTWQVSPHEGHVVLLAILGDQQLTDLLRDTTDKQIHLLCVQ
jgi:hypothetical protein